MASTAARLQRVRRVAPAAKLTHVAEANPDLVRSDDGLRRCGWRTSAPEYLAYHDDEWGRPVTDDVRMYEKICLEGFSVGLSWQSPRNPDMAA